MSKIFSEQGFLTEFGSEVFLKHLQSPINNILDTATSEAEVKMLGALLSKFVGDLVFQKSQSAK